MLGDEEGKDGPAGELLLWDSRNCPTPATEDINGF